MTTKICSECGLEKDRSAYHRGRIYKDRLMPKCKSCISKLNGHVPLEERPRPSGPPKTCTRCRIEKPASEFYRNKKARDGLNDYCRPCWKIKVAEYEAARPKVSVAEKSCSHCHVTKPAADFSNDRKRPDGLFPYCRACSRAIRQARIAKTRGVSGDGYREMVDRAGGLCEVCKKPPSSKGLNIDHDHKTGEVRGMLCSRCNLLLGHAQDNPETLLKMIAYLKKHNSLQDVVVPDVLPESL